MATAQYNVEGRLQLSGIGQGAGQVERVGAAFTRLGTAIRGTQSMFGGFVRQAMAFGAAFLGLHAIVGVFRGLIGSAIQFNAEIEQTRIGLASVLSSVLNIPFADAVGRAQGVFAELREDAIRSTATTQELFGIYQAIVGPISQAGFGLEVVRSITNDTVSAASALGVDFAQASRDVSAMVRGTAGVDVRLFSMLRSTGAIAEDAQAFNQLTQAERVERIRSALARFGPAAEAYGRSWAGVTSTFRDIKGQMLGILAGPTLELMTRSLRSLNELLLQNRERIEAYLSVIGVRIASTIGRVFHGMKAALYGVIRQWDQIVGRLQNLFRLVRTIAPPIALTMTAVSMGRLVLGGGLQALGGILGPIGSILGMLGSLGGTGGKIGRAHV